MLSSPCFKHFQNRHHSPHEIHSGKIFWRHSEFYLNGILSNPFRRDDLHAQTRPAVLRIVEGILHIGFRNVERSGQVILILIGIDIAFSASKPVQHLFEKHLSRKEKIIRKENR